MSLAEMKEEVRQLNETELDELAACVRLARKLRDPDWIEHNMASNAKMDLDGGTSEEALRKLHESLSAAGK